jgi:hypothetical protein
MAFPTDVSYFPHSAPTDPDHSGRDVVVLGTALATGLLVGLVLLRRAPSKADAAARQLAAWRTYLIDHLSGSDAATAVVAKLARSHAGTREGDVCAWLLPQLHAERDMVRSLIARDVTGSALSSKRLAGHASGAAAQALAGGQPGDIALFRTFETLCIGVQGQRLLWRAARERLPQDAHEARAQFDRLERAAIEQWERLDACRLALVAQTFGTRSAHGSLQTPPITEPQPV